MDSARLPTYFVSHGGGPWPWMEGYYRECHARLEESLAGMCDAIGGAPRAFLVVTGHWEARGFAVSAGEAPGMIHDFTGYPEYTYHVRYPAPGDPGVAARAAALLRGAGLEAWLDAGRGFDHGTFGAMQVIRPEADVPVVQLSVRLDLDPAAHLLAGAALAPLRDEGVLIVGSGLSFHNRRMMGPMGAAPSAAFDGWLQDVLVRRTPAERAAMLIDWELAPAARIAHPREEHLVPLMVAVGAAGWEAGSCVYHEDAFMGGVTVSNFRFG